MYYITITITELYLHLLLFNVLYNKCYVLLMCVYIYIYIYIHIIVRGGSGWSLQFQTLDFTDWNRNPPTTIIILIVIVIINISLIIDVIIIMTITPDN